MINIDLDDEFVNNFYGITNAKVPIELNLEVLKNQLNEIKRFIKENNITRNRFNRSAINTLSNDDEDEDEDKGPAILVVDDLGVITYQLKVLLSKFNMDIDCSQEIYDDVNKYKRRKYLYVVMDLFIPTEREGFILLTELKKLAASYNVPSVIGVITASPRKEIEQQCRLRGADFFLEKSNEWQSQLLNIMSDYINEGKEEEEY